MKIIKDYIYNLSYQIISIILPFLTIPYVSRVLGAEGVGISAYVNSIITYFVLFSNLGISVYGNRTIAYTKGSLIDRSRVFWEIMLIKIIMFLLSLSLFFLFMQFSSYYNFLKIQVFYIIASVLDISWLFLGLEQFKKLAIRNILVKIMSFASIFIFVKDRGDLDIYLLILACSSLFGNIVFWIDFKKYVLPLKIMSIDITTHLHAILLLSLPQLVSYAFMGVNKLILPNFSSLLETGLFDNADKTVRLLLTIVVAIGAVVFPRMANFFKTGEEKKLYSSLKLAFDINSLVTFPVVFGFILISKPFSEFFFGKDFNGISTVLSILIFELIFMGWTSLIGNQFFIAVKKEKILLISMIISLSFLIVFSVFLVPIYGAVGAAISSLIGEFIILCVQLYYLNKKISVRFLFGDVYKFIFSSLFMFLICLSVQNLFQSSLEKILYTIPIAFSLYFVCLWLLNPKIKSVAINYFKILGRDDER